MPRLSAPLLPLVTGLALASLPVQAQDAPGLSYYGVPGHITMPSAFALPDGVFALSVATQGDMIRRSNLVFQISPRITGAFRYGYLEDFNIDEGGISLYDRSFDVIFHLADENPDGWRPALALGLQDFGGTGIYGAEYLVASRHFGPRITASAGIGWGRFGSYGSFDNPLSLLSDRFDIRTTTGETGRLALDSYFRGDAALFFGMDWQATERLRLSLEYSSDAMVREAAIIGFDHRTPFNIGLDYRLKNGGKVGVSVLHGSALSFSFSRVLDPRRPAAPSGREPAPPAVRPGTEEALASWGPLETGRAAEALRPRLAVALDAQGIALEALVLDGTTATVAFSNRVWPAQAQAIGRTARVMSAALPADVTHFRLRSVMRGMPMQEVILTRQDLEALEYAPDGAWQAWVRAGGADAASRPDPRLRPEASRAFLLRPYAQPALFDPDNPLRFDLGAELVGEWSPLPGLYLSGAVRQKLAGNLDESTRVSTSVLPHVRSDAALYYKSDRPQVQWLTAEYFLRPARNLYGRLTLGLFEPMYGGASAELLWAPVDSRFALGLEVNQAVMRDTEGLGFQDYKVLTGHASAYVDIGGGYQAQLDAGRYLAGDLGATLTLTRRYGNGFEVSAFATLTDAGFDDFGEGAFDKGITITLPLSAGQPTRATSAVTLRPVLRDGGARLAVRNRLYDLTLDDREAATGKRWSRFWR